MYPRKVSIHKVSFRWCVRSRECFRIINAGRRCGRSWWMQRKTRPPIVRDSMILWVWRSTRKSVKDPLPVIGTRAGYLVIFSPIVFSKLTLLVLLRDLYNIFWLSSLDIERYRGKEDEFFILFSYILDRKFLNDRTIFSFSLSLSHLIGED